MQNKEIAIEVSGIGKLYKNTGTNGIFYALNNISFKVTSGEVIGLIGKNGSGKTTLLRILSGVIKPSKGSATLKGKILSVLEISGNFIPELTGTENIKIQLALMQTVPEKREELLKQVINFSGIGDFVHQPVKTYSNGMMLRLSFGLLFNTTYDILLLDEVLAVGDDAFRLKGMDFIRQLRNAGKTIILASHSKAEIQEICTRCIRLEDGQIVEDGDVKQVLDTYFRDQYNRYAAEENKHFPVMGLNSNETFSYNFNDSAPPENDYLKLIEISAKNVAGGNQLQTNSEILLKVRINKKTAQNLHVCIIITDSYNQPILTTFSLTQALAQENHTEHCLYTGILTYSCILPATLLAAGIYGISLQFGINPTIGNTYTAEALKAENICRFELKQPPGSFDFIGNSLPVFIRPECEWHIQRANNVI